MREVQTDTRSVFSNVPYEPSYERVFTALIATLVALGRKPTIVAEVPDQGHGRLQRIYREMAGCRVSFHDLSLVKSKLPRFNMPFELGIAWALQEQYPRRYDFFVFEAKPFRIQETLSDFNGIDPKVHGNTGKGAIAAALDCLGRKNNDLTVSDIHPLFLELRRISPDLKKENHSLRLYSARTFRALVSSATILAEERGLLN